MSIAFKNIKASDIDVAKYFPYKEFRNGQREAIEKILHEVVDNNKRYIFLNSPTGTGKSVIGVTLAKIMADFQADGNIGWGKDPGSKRKARSFLATTENILTKQYVDSFYESGLITTRMIGKDNYRCHIQDCSYTDGPCHLLSKDTSLFCKKDCDYLKTKKSARTDSILLTNYSYMTIQFDYIPEKIRIPNCNILISDEAHSLEDWLINYSEISIDKELRRLYKNLNKSIKNLLLMVGDYEIHKDIVESLKSFPEQSKIEYFCQELEKYCLEYEVHKNEDVLVRDFYSVLISLKEDSLKLCDEIDAIVEDYNESLDLNEDKIVDKEFMADLNKNQFFKTVRKLSNRSDFLRKFLCKISNMEKNFNEADWVADKKMVKFKDELGYEVEEANYLLKPLYAKHLWQDVYEKAVMQAGGFFLFMSATLPSVDLYCKHFGINPELCARINVASDFPKENRPVYYCPVVAVSHKQDREAKKILYETIKQIVEDNPTMKTLVHTGNYSIAEYLHTRFNEESKNPERFLKHTTETRLAVYEQFKFDNTLPYVLFSPSMMEGISLDGENFQLQIIAKVPYRSLADKMVVKKKNLNPMWYAEDAAIKIVQAAGRCVRSKEDFAVTYVLDANFQHLLNWGNLIFPEYFTEALSAV